MKKMDVYTTSLVVLVIFFLKEYFTEIFKGEDFQYYEDNTYTRSHRKL